MKFAGLDMRGSSAGIGTCQCDVQTHLGCRSRERCWDDPHIMDEAPVCLDPDLLLQIGSKCLFDNECASNACWYRERVIGAVGSCECNLNTNEGMKRRDLTIH